MDESLCDNCKVEPAYLNYPYCEDCLMQQGIDEEKESLEH